MRHIRVTLATVAGILATATTFPAVTQSAPRVPHGDPVELTFPAGEICPFPISISGVANITPHDGGEGVIVATGPFAATVTNLDTEESRTYNISGPELAGNVDVGSWLILQPASRNVGPPFLYLTHGRVTFTQDRTIDRVRGNVTDVCAALA